MKKIKKKTKPIKPIEKIQFESFTITKMPILKLNQIIKAYRRKSFSSGGWIYTTYNLKEAQKQEKRQIPKEVISNKKIKQIYNIFTKNQEKEIYVTPGFKEIYKDCYRFYFRNLTLVVKR